MNKHRGSFFDKARGVTLVELMVAMTISLIVMVGVGVIFVNTKKTYNTQERSNRVQENGRFAMYYLMRDLRMVGYTGCLSDINHYESTLNSPTDFSVNLAVPIEGMDPESGAATWYPSGFNDPLTSTVLLPNTDMVAIRLVDPTTGTGISDPMPNTSAELKVSNVSGFKENDIVLISDCANADLMQLTAVQTSSSHLQHNTGSGTPGNATKVLQKAYDTSAKVFKYSTRKYYIRNNAANIPSLYMESNGNSVELVEGIENLQISYGIDTDGDRQPNRFLKAGEAGLQSQTEWSNVVAIRFAVLARTLNAKDIDLDNNTYDVNGTNIGPFGDKNQRRVFTSTVLLRNLTKL